MNSSAENVNRLICDVAKATLGALKPGVFLEWRVEVYEAGDDHMTGDGYLCGAPWPRDDTSQALLTRCKIAVKHGLGFTSDATLESHQSTIRNGDRHSINPDVVISPNPGTGIAACLTLRYDVVPRYFVYVSVTSCDVNLTYDSVDQFAIKLYHSISPLGTRWLVGGALPEGYHRLGDPGPCYSCV